MDELEQLPLVQNIGAEPSPPPPVNGVWHEQCQEQSSSEGNAEVRCTLARPLGGSGVPQTRAGCLQPSFPTSHLWNRGTN